MIDHLLVIYHAKMAGVCAVIMGVIAIPAIIWTPFGLLAIPFGFMGGWHLTWAALARLGLVGDRD